MPEYIDLDKVHETIDMMCERKYYGKIELTVVFGKIILFKHEEVIRKTDELNKLLK